MSYLVEGEYHSVTVSMYQAYSMCSTRKNVHWIETYIYDKYKNSLFTKNITFVSFVEIIKKNI